MVSVRFIWFRLRSRGQLTQQQEFDVLCRLYAVLLEIALDEATPGGCGSLLGRLCAAHGAYCLDAKRFEGRLVSANSMADYVASEKNQVYNVRGLEFGG